MKTFEYTCGKCGEQFTSNEPPGETRCPECGAQICEHCEQWTGGPDA
jgi:DNA-directed RNA polymerase subunit RPC12/RpoP